MIGVLFDVIPTNNYNTNNKQYEANQRVCAVFYSARAMSYYEFIILHHMAFVVDNQELIKKGGF